MSSRACLIATILVLFLSIPGFGADRRSGAGLGLTRGTAESDIAFGEELDFEGYTVFYKHGVTDTWGVLVSYRDMEDDEDLAFGEKDEYTQLAVHAVYMWRAGKKVRPHVKFGLVNTDFEATVFGFSLSDDDVTVSVGGGFEAGSEKVAFFADLDYTEPEVEILVTQEFEIANLTLGVIFKF